MGWRGGRGGGGRGGGGRGSGGYSARGRGSSGGGGKPSSTRVIEINKRIKALGDARQIDDALHAFASLDEQGLRPTAVSYNVILFALVKCDKLQHATEIYQQMIGRSDVHANVVTLTSLLKGYAGAGDMKAASSLLEHMLQSKELHPNTRTLNTFLRGCLWTGDVDRGTKVFHQLCGVASTVSPDSTSVDYVLRLLASSLQFSDAEQIFGAYAKLVENTPFPLVALGEACAVAGDAQSANLWLDRALAALGSAAQMYAADGEEPEADRPGLVNFKNHQRAELQSSIQRVRLALALDPPALDAAAEIAGGGGGELGEEPLAPPPSKKRRSDAVALSAVRTAGAADSALISPQLRENLGRTLLFSSTGRVGHHGELGQTRDEITRALAFQLQSLGLPPRVFASTTEQNTEPAEGCEQGSAYYRGAHYGQFASSLPGVTQFLNGATCCGCCCDGSPQQFPCSRRCCSWSCGHWTCCGDSLPDSTHCRAHSQPSSVSSSLSVHDHVQQHIRRAIGAEGKIRLPVLFGISPAAAASRVINLEVCSGNGEWITAMASAHPQQLWCALELRHNRCASIFQRGVLAALRNLAVLGGDAAILCHHHLKKASVDRVLVTFPEPPAQHDHQEQGDHLLDENFVASVRRLLKPNGEFIIVTDNLPYAKVCARTTFGRTANGDTQQRAPTFVDIGDQPLRGHGAGGSGVNVGVPVGFEASDQGGGGSFFDRLWAGRGKSQRFFIQAKRA